MFARNETIFKWTLYSLATALCFLLQGAVLQRVTVWGVLPFLYPVLVAVVSSYEGAVAGTVYSLAVGVLCDLLLAAPLPCFYTLVFPVAGLCAALIAQGLLTTGALCSLVSSAAAFFLTDGFHCLLLWVRGKTAWQAGFAVMGKELAVTALLVLPVSWLFRAVYRRTCRDD